MSVEVASLPLIQEPNNTIRYEIIGRKDEGA
jgi:hypothetical protein